MCLSAGHSGAGSYGLSRLQSEAELIRRRAARAEYDEKIMLQAAVGSLWSDGKNFQRLLEELKRVFDGRP